MAAGARPFGAAAWFYAEYRYRPSDEFVRLLATHLGWSKSDRVLDLGAGPAHVSVQLGPYVGEVVVMDPEEAMLEEGRRRAAGVDNLSFVLGGSDDLGRLELGTFTTVVISQAFHWMRDKDGVLGELDTLLDRRRGAVAFAGYVKDPDYNRVWIDREPWNALEDILSPLPRRCSRRIDPRCARAVSRDSRALAVLPDRADHARAGLRRRAVARVCARALLLVRERAGTARRPAAGLRGRGTNRARRRRHVAAPRSSRRRRTHRAQAGQSPRNVSSSSEST
jgi:SAM-dependent methyltransferase